MDMLLAFGRNGARDTDLVPKEYSWDQLAQRLARPSAGDKDGLSRSQIYREIEQGTFPEGFLIARNSRAWFEHEIDHWLMERARRNPARAMPEQLKHVRKAGAA